MFWDVNKYKNILDIRKVVTAAPFMAVRLTDGNIEAVARLCYRAEDHEINYIYSMGYRCFRLPRCWPQEGDTVYVGDWVILIGQQMLRITDEDFNKHFTDFIEFVSLKTRRRADNVCSV
jgi:hypothetical protein